MTFSQLRSVSKKTPVLNDKAKMLHFVMFNTTN